MANRWERSESPKKHLDASLVPLEHSLLARAEALDALSERHLTLGANPFHLMAEEFRNLAEELYHW